MWFIACTSSDTKSWKTSKGWVFSTAIFDLSKSPDFAPVNNKTTAWIPYRSNTFCFETTKRRPRDLPNLRREEWKTTKLQQKFRARESHSDLPLTKFAEPTFRTRVLFAVLGSVRAVVASRTSVLIGIDHRSVGRVANESRRTDLARTARTLVLIRAGSARGLISEWRHAIMANIARHRIGRCVAAGAIVTGRTWAFGAREAAWGTVKASCAVLTIVYAFSFGIVVKRPLGAKALNCSALGTVMASVTWPTGSVSAIGARRSRVLEAEVAGGAFTARCGHVGVGTVPSGRARLWSGRSCELQS